MSKLLAKFIEELAAKAGIKADDAELLAIVQNKALATIDVPDALLGNMESNLHTLDSATAKIKSKVAVEVYNGLDAELERFMNEEGLEDSVKAELKGEKSTTKRAVLIAKKLKELESKKAAIDPSKGKEETNKLIEQINKLNGELSTLKTTHQSELTRLQSDFATRENDMELNTMLGGYEYGLGDIDNSVKQMTARNMLNAAMQNEGVKVVRENGRLKLVTNDGADYFDKSNNKKDLKSFLEGSINGILKAADPGNGGNNNTHKTTTTVSTDPKASAADQNFLSELDQQIAAQVKA